MNHEQDPYADFAERLAKLWPDRVREYSLSDSPLRPYEMRGKVGRWVRMGSHSVEDFFAMADYIGISQPIYLSKSHSGFTASCASFESSLQPGAALALAELYAVYGESLVPENEPTWTCPNCLSSNLNVLSYSPAGRYKLSCLSCLYDSLPFETEQEAWASCSQSLPRK